MRISKELIEKYHDGFCTPDEKHAVEEWLFSDEAEEKLQFSDDHARNELREEIWNGLAADVTAIRFQQKSVLSKFLSGTCRCCYSGCWYGCCCMAWIAKCTG